MLSRRRRFAVVAVLMIVVGAACSSGPSNPASDLPAPQGPAPVPRDVAPTTAGIAEATNTSGDNCAADLDADGFPDLVLSMHAQRPWPLFRGLPDGRFERSDRLDLDLRDRHGCVAADFDADGLLDVYLSVGGCEGRCRAAKELWIQQPDGTFVDEAAAWGVDDPGGRGRTPTVLDANGDDLPDLYTGQEVGVEFPSFNRLWINRGDRFELQEGPQTNELGNRCSAATDLNGDGLDELAVCTPDHGSFIYRNVDGRFVEATESFGVESEDLRNIEFADVDADGLPDLATITGKRVQISLNEGGRFGEPVLDVGLYNGIDLAFGDVDADGDLDLYVQHGSGDHDVIILNERGGRRFAFGAELPLPRNGVGDSTGASVVAIPDWKGTGRAAFLVNNGKSGKPAGNRQLFEFTG